MIEPQRWQEVDRIFAEALERPPGERTAFLDAACLGDPGLRQKVERLLAADQMGADFLERPPGELLALALEDADDPQEEGESLGPYRLLRRIGSGGMGTVYRARREDEHYQRDVAIKVLRSGLASTEAYHRFLAERQILANLEHPNIARLYDGGSMEDGRPYLVMELVEGVPVHEYCDQNRLTVEQRLVLFQKICAAVQYAHQNLLVHRDLKPGNILITPEGEPKLLDFGIAKRLAPETDGSLQKTLDGMRMLTPRYASPEQVKGEAITTASDVYSLGVILYELLAGRSPYQISAERPYEVVLAICEQEPEAPSAALLRPVEPLPEDIARARKTRPLALRQQLQGDLDNIVLMALRKEPQRRYGSATQLAQDLERHLQVLPVTARPDTLRYRTLKLLRRNRTAAALTAVMVLLAAGFMASLIAQGRQLARERDKARYALSFVVDTFKQADPYKAQGEKITAREILNRGADRISRELSGQPDVQAAVMDAIGEVNVGLGRLDEAEPLLSRSLVLRRSQFGPGSLEVAESLEHLAKLQDERADWEGAESSLRQALAIRRRLQGDDDIAVARTLNQLGSALLSQGASPDVAPQIEALHQEALAIARSEEGPEGLTVAETLIALSYLQRELGSYAEAERLFQEGWVIKRKVLGEHNPDLWRDQTELGHILIEAGKFKEAEVRHRKVLELQKRVLGPEHPDVWGTLNNLGLSIHLQGRYAEAEALQRQALALAREHYGPESWVVGMVLGNLAISVHAQDRAEEALRYYEEVLKIRRQILGEEDPLVAQSLLQLASLHREGGQYEKGLQLAHQAQGILEKAVEPDHPHMAFVVREIGRNYLAQNRFSEAEPFLRRSLEIRRKKLEAGHPDLAKAQVALARCLISQGQYDEASTLLKEARGTFADVYGPDHEMARLPDELMAEIEGRKGKAD